MDNDSGLQLKVDKSGKVTAPKLIQAMGQASDNRLRTLFAGWILAGLTLIAGYVVITSGITAAWPLLTVVGTGIGILLGRSQGPQ